MTGFEPYYLLPRWHATAYDFEYLYSIIRILIQNFVREQNINPYKHDAELIVKLLIYKEFKTLSLRSAEDESEKIARKRIDHSVIHYWEKKLATKLKYLLDKILTIFQLFPYQRTIADSTIWSGKKNLRIKLITAIRYCKIDYGTIFPVAFSVTNSPNEFSEEIPLGEGGLYADGEFDTKKFLNNTVRKGYYPIIKPSSNSPSGIGDSIRDAVFNAADYLRRNVGESLFGAFTVWFQRLRVSLPETGAARVYLWGICYCMRILGRGLHLLRLQLQTPDF